MPSCRPTPTLNPGGRRRGLQSHSWPTCSSAFLESKTVLFNSEAELFRVLPTAFIVQSDMLLAVEHHLHGAYACCYVAYSYYTKDFQGQYFNDVRGKGPQQRDRIGPLIFSMTIEPLLTSLSSSLNLGYLDDLTMGNIQPAVAAYIKKG